MTDDSSKDSTEMLVDLSKAYGCYGIKTATGLAAWCTEWVRNGGDPAALSDCRMWHNEQTDHMTLWTEEAFNG